MLDKRILENCDLANDDQARLKSAEREQFIDLSNSFSAGTTAR